MRIGTHRARRGKEGAENTGRADPRGLAEFCCFSQSGLEPPQGQQKPAGPVSERPSGRLSPTTHFHCTWGMSTPEFRNDQPAFSLLPANVL